MQNNTSEKLQVNHQEGIEYHNETLRSLLRRLISENKATQYLLRLFRRTQHVHSVRDYIALISDVGC